jgi:hypothetical protein
MDTNDRPDLGGPYSILQEDEMASQAAVDTLAEFAAINTAIHRILIHLAKKSPNPSAFLSKELKLGLEELSQNKLLGRVPIAAKGCD